MKPKMAYPTIASATYTFAPDKWPVANRGGVSHQKFMADGITAGGSFIRQESSLGERVINIEYHRLSATDKDAFAAQDESGFFYDVGGKAFEYLHSDGVIYTVRFYSSLIKTRFTGDGRFDIGPIELLIGG